MTKAPFYITTPIYYVNDRPHMGHAYTTVACDALARFMRLRGHPVWFLTGTDEHGQKVEKSAAAKGIAPQDFVDDVSRHFREMTRQLNVSNNDFIRTTEPRHMKAVQALWTKMQEKGHIYLGKYAGWYAVRDEAFYAESELVDGKAPTGAPVEWVEEPSYFFDLSKWQDKLLAYYEAHPEFIAPESRRNEVISFVKGGLKDLSISRTTFSWGIPVPGDEKHIMYVWLDALTNYISALGYPDEKNKNFKDFWPASVHMVGKDILRFHAVYWPAFLMAADLPLPGQVFAHGWWTVEGEKISKSLGNAIPVEKLIEEFGLDQTRYFLLREVPFGNDGNFSRAGLINRINSELANNIGNLVQRTLSMINKNCEGKVPGCGPLIERDQELLNWSGKYADGVTINIEGYTFNIQKDMMNKAFHHVVHYLVLIGFEANKYIDDQAPWKLKKEDSARMETVLWVLAETIKRIAIMLQPFIPESSSKILAQLAVSDEERSWAHLTPAFNLKSGTPLPPPQPVFPRFLEKEEA